MESCRENIIDRKWRQQGPESKQYSVNKKEENVGTNRAR